MRNIFVALVIVTILLQPTVMTDFEEAFFTSEGVEVQAWFSADVPWFSPYSQNVSVDLLITPTNQGVTEINVTKITLVVNKRDISSDTYTYVASTEKVLSPVLVGTSTVIINETLTISGVTVGQECYFAVAIEGSFRTVNNTYAFTSASPENFVGSFSIFGSLESPLTQIGILVIAMFSVLIVGGFYLYRRSQGRERPRASLLQE